MRVSILDPEKMFELADAATQVDLAGLPEEARARLSVALRSLVNR